MQYHLENEFLKIEINSIGAELTGIAGKPDGYNYLWNGEPNYWAHRAPILFPIIGNLSEGRYLYKGKEYLIGRHGFASKMSFKKHMSNQNSVTLSLSHNDDTMSQYPFEFLLLVTYTLNERTVKTTFQVKNTGGETMWFSIGGHPGFNCSVGIDGKKKGTLIFEKFETVNRIINENGYLTDREEPFFNGTDKIPIDSLSFDGKTKVYIFEGLKSEEITLIDEYVRKKVKVRFHGFPYLGIWSPRNEAPFICIEPWYGVTGTLGKTEVLEDKRGILNLKAGESFTCSYEITCD